MIDRPRLLRVCLLIGVLLVPLAVMLPAAAPTSDPVDDPLPLRRIVLAPDRAERELERRGSGALVQMPLTEFDDLLRKAARRQAAARATPRLIAANYSARLDGESLIGSGSLRVLNPSPDPAYLRLSSSEARLFFNLALLKPPQFENRPAQIADFSTAEGQRVGPSLRLDAPGEHTVMLDWSARGDPRPDGNHFSLRLPPAVATLLELDLPPDQAVSLEGQSATSADIILSGPHTAELPALRRWRITSSTRESARDPERDRLTFRVRPLAPDGRGPPVVLCQQRTSQMLRPGSLEGRFEFQLEAPRRGVAEVQFVCDRSLVPTNVEVLLPAAALKEWEPHREPGGTTRVTVRFVEAIQSATVRIDALASLRMLTPTGEPVKDGVAWASPSIRPIGVVSRGEELTIEADPDLQLTGWQSGDFRLVESNQRPDAERRELLQRLRLIGGGIAVDAATGQPRRPSAHLLAPGTEYRARQLAWWQVRPGSETLTVQVKYEVMHGELGRLPLVLPPGWNIEAVEVKPAELLLSYKVDRADREDKEHRGRPVLMAQLVKALRATPRPDQGSPRREATLIVRLRSPRLRQPLTIPDTDPMGRSREGALAIDVDEQALQPTPRILGLPASEPELGEEGPWGRQVPLYYYPYRGAQVTGVLDVRPRPALVRAKCVTKVSLTAGRPMVETRLTLEAEAGSASAVELSYSTPAGSLMEWRRRPVDPPLPVERVFHGPAAPVAVLSSQTPMEVAAMATLLAEERWRLVLPQPLHGSEPLHLYAFQLLEPHEGSYAVPLPVLVGAERLEGEVALHLTGGDALQVESSGLREASELRSRAGPWRSFRYNAGPVHLELHGQPGKIGVGAAGSAVLLDHARLTTFVGPGDTLRHHFAFQAANWPQRTLPVILPPGAHPVAAQADGEILAALAITEAANDRKILALPVPQRGAVGDGWHRFEVVYVTEAPAWYVWGRAEAPVPELPAEPIRFRRSWRLPPGVAPLSEAFLRRLPGPGEPASFSTSSTGGRRPADLFRLGLPTNLFSTHGNGNREQHQALADAGLGVRSGHAGQEMPLGDVIDLVAANWAREHRPLVIDAVALREARLGPRARLTVKRLDPSGNDLALPWEPIGLTAVFAQSIPVLTTHRQAELWEAIGEHAQPLSADLDEAIALAAQQGHDPSGRFLLASNWLRHETEAAGTLPDDADDGSGPWSLLSPGLTLGHWTEWEPRSGVQARSELIVVRREAVTALAALLTAGLLMAFWRLGRWGVRWRGWFLGLWLATSGTALFLAPPALNPVAWWTFLAACGVTLAWYVVALVRSAPTPAPELSTPRVQTHFSRVTGTTGAVIFLFAACAWSVSGQEAKAPAVWDVYLVPGSTPEQSIALITTDLNDRLRAMAQPPAGPSAVLLSADYQGKVVGQTAHFTAKYQAHNFTDGTATLLVPLGGVRLYDGALVDGQQILPTTVPNQTGFAFRLPARGPHQIEVAFEVPVSASLTGEYTVSFAVPRLNQCHLSFQAPAKAAALVALSSSGKQEIVDKDSPAGPRLEAELGRVSSATPGVTLHWYDNEHTVPPEKVRFREAYVWNLQADRCSLTAAVRYEIPSGLIDGAAIDLPPELEVSKAEVIAGDGAARSRQGVPLRDWYVETEGDQRVLRLYFQRPVGGWCDVIVELVPRQPLKTSVVLPLPSPRGEPGGIGYLAYRTDGIAAQLQRSAVLRVTPVRTDDFVKAWPVERRGDLGTLAYAGTFRRELKQGPVLPVILSPQHPSAAAVQEVFVRAGSRQVELRARATLTAKVPLAFVEWDIQAAQPVTVTAVTDLTGLPGGSVVRRWSQFGSRVQVWLEPTPTPIKLELTGWWPLTAAPPGRETTLTLPCLRLAPVQEQKTTVRLSTASGLSLSPAPTDLKNLTAVPPDPNLRELVYVAQQPEYGGKWSVHRAGCEASAKLLTFVELAGGQLNFTASVLLRVREGELQTAQVRLRDWDKGTVKIDAPRGLLPRGERRGAGGERIWTVEIPPGVNGEYRLMLRGSMPLTEASAGVWAPDVTVSVLTPLLAGPGRMKETVESWMALGPKLTLQDGHGVEAAGGDPAAALADWPEEAKRFSHTNTSLWKLPTTALVHGLRQPASASRLRLLSPNRERPAETVQVFLSEQTAAVADGQHWLHEATYWLRHEANAELNVSLPAAARVIAVSVDGGELVPLQPDRTRLWLPLPHQPGVRWVRLRWLYDDEPLSYPNLAKPTLEGAHDGPALWTVYAPAGFRADQGEGIDLRPGLARAAMLDVHRAAAQGQIIAHLTEEFTRAAEDSENLIELGAAERRFYQYCRQAEREFVLASDGADTSGPQGRSSAEWLVELQKTNRELAAQDPALEKLRSEAERQADHVSPVLPLPDSRSAEAAVAPEGPRYSNISRVSSGAGGTTLPERGTSLAGFGEPAANPPLLALVPVAEEERRWAWWEAMCWLSLLLVAWLLTLIPGMLRGTRAFWPEQLLLLAAVGWLRTGTQLVVMALVIAWAGVRIVQSGRWLLRHGNVWMEAPAQPSVATERGSNVEASGGQ